MELVPGATVVEVGDEVAVCAEVPAGAVVGITGASWRDLAAAVVVVVVPLTSSRSDGSCTGLTNTMMQTRAATQAPAIPNNLRLRSMAPIRAARNKPLKRRNNTMLTELLTGPAYQTPRD